MTMSIHWHHTHPDAESGALAGKAMKALKGALVAVGIAAVTAAIVALRVYLFVPSLH